MIGIEDKLRIGDKVTAEIRRGPGSWTFFYIVLGFALSIEGTCLQMIEPLRFPYNIICYGALMAGTFWLFICNAWFHGKLIGIKGQYEDKVR